MQVGTLTYVDPEYMRTGEYSTKSDIYALGRHAECAIRHTAPHVLEWCSWQG